MAVGRAHRHLPAAAVVSLRHVKCGGGGGGDGGGAIAAPSTGRGGVSGGGRAIAAPSTGGNVNCIRYRSINNDTSLALSLLLHDL